MEKSNGVSGADQLLHSVSRESIWYSLFTSLYVSAIGSEKAYQNERAKLARKKQKDEQRKQEDEQQEDEELSPVDAPANLGRTQKNSSDDDIPSNSEICSDDEISSLSQAELQGPSRSRSADLPQKRALSDVRPQSRDSDKSFLSKSTDTPSTVLRMPETEVQTLMQRFVDAIRFSLWDFGKYDLDWVKGPKITSLSFTKYAPVCMKKLSVSSCDSKSSFAFINRGEKERVMAVADGFIVVEKRAESIGKPTFWELQAPVVGFEANLSRIGLTLGESFQPRFRRARSGTIKH